MRDEHDRVDHRIGTSRARQDQVFVKRAFHGARIRKAKHCTAGFNVIGDPETGLRLPIHSIQSVIEISADSCIDGLRTFRDAVFNVHPKLFNVGVLPIVI